MVTAADTVQDQIDLAMLAGVRLPTRAESRSNGVSMKSLADAYAFIDVLVPPWMEQPTILSDYGAYCTPETMNAREREVGMREGIYVVYGQEYYLPQRPFVMPFQRYIRAMDAAGNVCPLSISTFRHGTEPDQIEGQLKYQSYVETVKPRRGWLICEHGGWQKMPGDTLPMNVRDDESYGRYLMEQFVKRTLANRHKMAVKDEEHRNEQEKLARESLKTQNRAQETLEAQNAALQSMLLQQNAVMEALLNKLNGGGGTTPAAPAAPAAPVKPPTPSRNGS